MRPSSASPCSSGSASWRSRAASTADEEFEARAEALDAMVRPLRRLVEDGDGDDRPDCPILDDVAAPPEDDTL